MAEGGDAAFNTVLKGMNACLRGYGFKRTGQTFSRHSPDCWQVISAQKSVYSTAKEKNFTINFGIYPKAVLTFAGKDLGKPPLYYTCPIRFRISRFVEGCNDEWWPLSDPASAEAALADVSCILSS